MCSALKWFSGVKSKGVSTGLSVTFTCEPRGWKFERRLLAKAGGARRARAAKRAAMVLAACVLVRGASRSYV